MVRSEVAQIELAARRVKRGAKYLDKKFPTWRRVLRKHSKDFDIADGECCILGTLEHFCRCAKELTRRAREKGDDSNGYSRLVDVLKIDGKKYGFEDEHYTFSSLGDRKSDYEILQRLWRAEFGAKQAEI